MEEIKLSCTNKCKYSYLNLVALVDGEDFEYLNQWKWYALKGRNNNWVARRGVYAGGRRMVSICMHHDIMGKPPKGMVIDHKDRNGLNNQRSNLRFATLSQNAANRRSCGTSRSKYLGVHFEKDRQKWTARIRKNNKGIRLGQFDSEIDAAKAYNEGALKYHGEFANLNII